MRCQTCGKEFVTANRICPYCKSKNKGEIREQPLANGISYQRIRPSNTVATNQPTERTKQYIPPPPPTYITENSKSHNSVRIRSKSDTFLLIIIAGCSVLIFVIWLGIMGASSEMDSYSELGTSGISEGQFGRITATKGELVILQDQPLTEGSYLKMQYVVGIAKNVGGKRINMGSVDAKFFDKSGNLLSTRSDYVQDLDPGQTWRFKILYGTGTSEASTYKVEVGSTW